jgi:phosphoserine phosphatase
MREIILVNVTGRDHPGLTTALANVLSEHGVNILDIGQAGGAPQRPPRHLDPGAG